jgi:hypothetical protein
MSSESAKVDLPLSATANAKAAISTCTTQVAAIQQAPGYSTTTSVQTVVADLTASVTVLQGTTTKVDQLKAELLALEGTQAAQLVTVQLKHDAVVTALNVASNGSALAAQQWVGKVKVRAKSVTVSTATPPPEEPMLRLVKSVPGSVKASCKAEDGVVCYLFQQGSDPAHPELWPAPVMSPGSTHVAQSQPIGQIVYVRIAVVRRGSVQGQWSPILQIQVR